MKNRTTDSQTENIEKAFYHDGYQLGMKVVEAKMEEKVLKKSISVMYSSIDALVESLAIFAKQQGQSIDCRLGCDWCCHQPVFSLDYELQFLSNFITKHFDNETTQQVKERAQQNQDKRLLIEKDDLLNDKSPCPLLRKGACMAYEARPMACRIYLSSDAGSCRHFYDNPEDEHSYPALLDLPMRLGRMMNEGFKAALKTEGLDPKEYRIEEKLV